MRQQQLIEKATGPAPWYWETLPEPTGASGRRYIWTYHREQGPIGYLVTLSARQDPQSTLLALNTYSRVFLVPPGRFGIWCPEYSPSGGSYLRVMCFDPDQLNPFPLTEVAGWFKQSADRVYSTVAPQAEFEIPILDAGAHRLDVPAEFRSVEGEMFLVNSSKCDKKEAMQDILILRLATGEVEVLPQNWLTSDKYDQGYQWITRVTRDPATGHLIGDGIRLGRFELTDDGRHLARWIE